jgi:tRNA(Ile)-lysidine synthase
MGNAKEQQLKWREDSTNKEDKYQRNYIRHHVVPELKEIFPSINASIQSQYNRNQQLLSFLKDQLVKESSIFYESKNGQLRINKKLQLHPQGELLLHTIIEPYGFSISRTSEIFNSITTGAYWQSLSYQCWNDRQHWILKPNQTSFEQEYWIEEGMHELEFGPHFHLRCSFTSREDFAVSENIAWLNADVLKFPLLLRTAREGDKIQPLGMDGSKKISDLLIDLKVSRADKNQVWVIESDSEIAWVLGYRISHRFRLLPDTEKVYKIIFNS